MREAVLTDLWFTIRYVLGWWFLDEKLHGQRIMQFCKDTEEQDRLILIPRGFGKTMWTIAEYVVALLANQNLSILSLTATDDLSKKKAKTIGDILRYNKTITRYFADIVVPQDGRTYEKWGTTGIILPNREPRMDLSFDPSSIGTAITGKHNDLCDIDDITGLSNNTPQGWQQGYDAVKELHNILGSKGLCRWSATHWHDSAPARLAEQGILEGARGKFAVLKLSCFEDDDPTKPCIYPEAYRWNSDKISGYSRQRLLEQMVAGSARDRAFFSAQMRNDPVPADDVVLNVKSIELYDPKEVQLKLTPIMGTGIEIIGGGQMVYNAMLDKVKAQGIRIQLREVKRPSQKGVTKEDKILVALEPIINYGRMHAPHWMFPDDPLREDTLEYELTRLGAAKNDDIADALAMLVTEMGAGGKPYDEDSPMHAYIMVDCAFTANEHSDYTVCICAAKDHNEHWWLIDYDRFQLASPDAICNRIINFYQKWNNQGSSSGTSKSLGRKSVASKYSDR